MTQKVFLGTEIKLNVSIDPIGDMTMDDYDFNVEAICGTFKKRSVTFKKVQAIRVDENNFIICLDTAAVGTGELKLKVTAFLPDGDFADGKRTEIVEVGTGVEIVKTM